VRSSAIRFVSVVTRVRSPLATCALISPMRSSTCPRAGRTSTWGSTSPVGRTICSTTCALTPSSYGPGVAETNTIWGTSASNSSNVSGRLSYADGSRNPKSTRFFLRARSPSCIPRTWGTVTCDSSITTRKSLGK